MSRRLLAVAALAALAWFLWPQYASGTQLDRTAEALALAGPASAAALAVAAGRPVLVAGAMAGVGAYVSAILSLHGVAVPLAVLAGAAGGASVAAAVAGLCARADGPGVLVITLTLSVAGGALIQALPAVTGAESGLGPLPALSVPLGGGRTAVATPVGDFHVLLVVASVVALLASFLLRSRLGAAWRAVGSDRARAAVTGISPLRAELAVLAVGGALAGICGALAAHVGRVATPDAFGLELAALPLLAAFAAGRDPLAAAAVALATGIAGDLVLPVAGWTGPPDGMALALGVLAIAALFTLLPSGGETRDAEPTAVAADAPWPIEALRLRGARLSVEAIEVRGRGGEPLVEAPPFTVEPGTVLAVVGPNGAGKTTLFRTMAGRARRRPPGATGDRLVLLPQDGGGFASCTVDETLRLAAAPGRTPAEAGAVAAAWRTRLGLDGSGRVLCAELSAGRRRLLDLARVLLTSPAVLVCDEPLAGLDDAGRAAAVSCLRAAAAAGLTIVLSEHDRAAVDTLAGSILELERPDWALEHRVRSATR